MIKLASNYCQKLNNSPSKNQIRLETCHIGEWHFDKPGHTVIQRKSSLCKVFLNLGAAIAQWIRLCLPSRRPGFNSQAQDQHFYQFIFELRHVEKTKMNRKEIGIGPDFQSLLEVGRDWSNGYATRLVLVRFWVQILGGYFKQNYCGNCNRDP